MNDPPRELKQLQRWMQAVIMHPEGIVGGIESESARSHIDIAAGDVERVIRRSHNLTSIERLAVYGNSYIARLVEVLRDEFPAVRHAIGDDAFDGFAFGYLQAYPSRSYTLADLSIHFSRYLQETRPPADAGDTGPDWVDFLIDLTALERAYSEVFAAAGPEGGRHLRPEDLERIPPAKWAAARLIPTPCVRLMSFRFPVHEYATAVRRGEDPGPPDARETLLVMGRRDFVVRREAVSRQQFELLKGIIDGLTLGEAILRTVEETSADVDSLGAQIGQWFKNWSAAQFFSAIQINDESSRS